MVKLNVRKNKFLKFIGLVGALFIVVFGNVSNFLRTIGLIEEKRTQKK
jgi:hypothetical protein